MFFKLWFAEYLTNMQQKQTQRLPHSLYSYYFRSALGCIWSLSQIKRTGGEQDIRVSDAGRWKGVFITHNVRSPAAQRWGTDMDLLIWKILPTPLCPHVSVCLFVAQASPSCRLPSPTLLEPTSLARWHTRWGGKEGNYPYLPSFRSCIWVSSVFNVLLLMLEASWYELSKLPAWTGHQ